MSSDSDSEEGRMPVDDDVLESDSELHNCLTTARMDAEQRQELRDRGIVVREGMWTGMEDKRLRENMKIICQVYGIDEPRKVIYPDEYEGADELKNLIREKQLLGKLSKGIQRPTYNVYIRARKIFDPKNYLGRFSSEEVQQMKRLTRTLGTQWSKIGREMGRSGRSLCDKFKISDGRFASGEWSPEEKQRLIRVVKQVTGFNRDRNVERLYFKVPWTTIADRMKTRNVAQCRIQWVHILSWAAVEFTDRETRRQCWNTNDNIRLIEKLYKANVNSEQDIDWMALLDYFPSVPSPQKLSNYWYHLKVRFVPNHHFKSFEDNVELLHNRVLPDLRRKVADTGVQNISPEFVEEEDEDEDEEEDEEGAGTEGSGGTMDTTRPGGQRSASGKGRGRVQREEEGTGVQTPDGGSDDGRASRSCGDDHDPETRLRNKKKKKKKKRKKDSHSVLEEQCLSEEEVTEDIVQDESVSLGRTHSVHGSDRTSQPERDPIDPNGGDSARGKKRKKKKRHHRSATEETGGDTPCTSESVNSMDDDRRSSDRTQKRTRGEDDDDNDDAGHHVRKKRKKKKNKDVNDRIDE